MAPAALLSTGTFQHLCPICGDTKRWQPKRLVSSRSALTRASTQASINKASVKSSISLASLHSVFGRRRRSGLGPEARCPSRPVFTASVDVEGSIALDETSAAPITVSESEEEKIDEFATGAVEQPPLKAERFKPRVPGQKMRREDATVPAEALVEGAVFTGKVTTIQSFGAFVNFGAFTDGLVHISKMSTGYVSNVNDIVSLGQEVKVTILNVEQKSGRIALSMVDKEELEAKVVAGKAVEASEGNDRSRFQQGPDGRPVNRGRIAGGGRQGRRDEPQKPPTKLTKGQEVEGTVKNKIRSGVFVELPENEEGFLRYSDIPGGDNMAPEASLQTGEKIKATVLRIDRGKIVLTMKPIVDISSVNRDINKGSDSGATNPFEIAFRAFNLVPAEPTSPVEVDSAVISVASSEEVAPVVEDSLAGVDEASSEEKLLVESVLAVAEVAVAGEEVIPTETLSAPEEPAKDEAIPEEPVEAIIEQVAAKEAVEAFIEAAAPEEPAFEEAVAEKEAIPEEPVVESPTAEEKETELVSEELLEAVAEKEDIPEEPVVESPTAEEKKTELVSEELVEFVAEKEAIPEEPVVESPTAEEKETELVSEELVEAVARKAEAAALEEPALEDEEQVEEVAPAAEATALEEPAIEEEETVAAVAPEAEAAALEEPALEKAVAEKEPEVVPEEPVEAVAPEAKAAAPEEPAIEEAVAEKEPEVVPEEPVLEASTAGEPELAPEEPMTAVAPEAAATTTIQESSAEKVTAGISPALVKQLRDETGAGMMDCKRALTDTNGDIEKARETLRKKGLASADKKASRVASEGLVGSYVHDSRIGVLVEVNCETDFVSRGSSFKSLVDDLGMQVVACPQVQFVSVEDIPAEKVDKEKEMEAQREDLMNKPEAIRSRIVEGRVSKRLNEIALLEQAFIRDDSILVKDLVKQTIAYLGENIKVRRFERYVLGEGLQKRGTDFAAEVAAQTGVKAPKPVESPKTEEPSAPAPTPEAENKVIVSAALVKELRDQTGAGMMDCKKALASTENDVEKAVEFLRKKGLASADKKASRLASEGLIGTYIHDGRIGVLIEVNCETDFVARGERFKELVEDLAMQVAAYPQVQVVSVDDVPAEVVTREKELESEKEDLASKPEAIRTRIVDGRVAKRLSELALLDQPFIKDDKKLVKDILKETIAGLGENIQVRRFTRFNLGENIEKKVVDFASEVAAQSGRKG